MTRAVFIMLDGVGVGELPDSDAYGDAGANTLGNLAHLLDLRLPNLRALGLGNILPLPGVLPVASPAALVGRLAPRSAGKDTTVGHWEHMGLVTPRPFPTYPDGFPDEVTVPFQSRIGRGILGNRPASGTSIIEELGEEHLDRGWPIVYTSADSVFQIAAHTGVVPLEQLYEWCRIAREILTGPHAVARVIARPFTGSPGRFSRTKDRRDFSLEPTGPTYLDRLKDLEVPVLALGKITEIYLGRGVSTTIKVGSNAENLTLLTDLLRGSTEQGGIFTEGLLFSNLVDFDMLWGHRNDPEGFARGLEAVDSALPGVLQALGPNDRLVISADHGVDPTTWSTDHSREYAPLLYYPRPRTAPHRGYEGTFADTGASVYAHLTGRPPDLDGRRVEDLLPERGWRPYTSLIRFAEAPRTVVPVVAWAETVGSAAAQLRLRFGEPPQVAVILGSGMSTPFRRAIEGSARSLGRVAYGDIPGWQAGSVPGHPGAFEMVELESRRIALLEGRLHAYEGHDLGRLQLPIRSLSAWGTELVILTCAAGALDAGTAPGGFVLVTEVLDLHFPQADGYPSRIVGTDEDVLADLVADGGLPQFVRRGVHAAVPGPQYETEAENDLLRGMGAVCVGMSLPSEIRAARECGLKVVVLSLITNSGVTTHEDVLTAAAAQGTRLAAATAAVIAVYSSA